MAAATKKDYIVCAYIYGGGAADDGHRFAEQA